jgi:hypothetical protein
MSSPTIAVGNSVFGTWTLLKDSSDLIPPFEKLDDSPLSCSFTGQKDDELVLTSRHDFNGIEEVIMEGTANDAKITRTYQIGKLNFEKFHGTKVICAILVGILNNFESFIIIRYGPAPNSNRL